MAAPPFVSIDEYLSRSYRPDCDYIDGEVRQRNVGERPHSLLQVLLGSIFFEHRDRWQVLPLPGQRIRVSAARVRVADLCVVRRSDPPDPVVIVAPLLCIEILSGEDRLREMQERIEEYLGMGVKNIWVIDPDLRLGYVGGKTGLVHPVDGVFTVAGTPIRVELTDLFACLDRMKAGV